MEISVFMTYTIQAKVVQYLQKRTPTQKIGSFQVETGVKCSSLFDISADLATNNETSGTSFKNETSDIPYSLGSSLLAEDGHKHVANE